MSAFDWSEAPEWAVCVTTDSHGYVIAWDREPKQTQGGVFYNGFARSEILQRPGYSPEVFRRPEAPHAEA